MSQAHMTHEAGEGAAEMMRTLEELHHFDEEDDRRLALQTMRDTAYARKRGHRLWKDGWSDLLCAELEEDRIYAESGSDWLPHPADCIEANRDLCIEVLMRSLILKP